MIIGENSRENDLTVNITTAKQMTNVRSATKDQTAVIKHTYLDSEESRILE